MCGYPKTHHKDEAIKPEDYMGQQYDKHKHIRELPTDAYGDIRFGGIGQKTGMVNGNLGDFSVKVFLSVPMQTTLEFWSFVETLEFVL